MISDETLVDFIKATARATQSVSPKSDRIPAALRIIEAHPDVGAVVFNRRDNAIEVCLKGAEHEYMAVPIET